VKRRKILLAIFIVLSAFNVAYITYISFSAETAVESSLSTDGHEDSTTRWVAYMPELEASLRTDPLKGTGLHSPLDPRFLNLFERVDGELVNRLSMIAGECHIASYSIRNANDISRWMPDRLFARELSRKQQDCLASHLPNGYVLAELRLPLKPSRVPSSTDLSTKVQNGNPSLKAQ
jgi:hypothetical protein